MTHSTPLILAADIGGTNTRLALLDGTTLRQDSVARYENAKATHLDEILRDYLSKRDAKPAAVSLALAGPVEGDHGKLTNLDWSITTKGASESANGALGVLLNDLQAQGHALPYLSQDAFRTVQTAPVQQNANSSLMIGIGTGMNVAPVHSVGTHTFVPPAEAGHTNFIAQDDALIAFGAELEQRLGHVANEDILSGRGLERAYRHVSGDDIKAKDIMQKCANGDAAADTAVGLLVRTLGHFAGDMALTLLPHGGIYLVGGVARALFPYMERHGFAACFAAKGRFAPFMAQFSIKLVEDDYAALVGAASYAQERLNAA